MTFVRPKSPKQRTLAETLRNLSDLQQAFSDAPAKHRVVAVYCTKDLAQRMQQAEDTRTIAHGVNDVSWARIAAAAFETTALDILRENQSPANTEVWPIPPLSVRERAMVLAALLDQQSRSPHELPTPLLAVATGNGAFNALDGGALSTLIEKLSKEN